VRAAKLVSNRSARLRRCPPSQTPASRVQTKTATHAQRPTPAARSQTATRRSRARGPLEMGRAPTPALPRPGRSARRRARRTEHSLARPSRAGGSGPANRSSISPIDSCDTTSLGGLSTPRQAEARGSLLLASCGSSAPVSRDRRTERGPRSGVKLSERFDARQLRPSAVTNRPAAPRSQTRHHCAGDGLPAMLVGRRWVALLLSRSPTLR
jgi:hypothetical protein